jgi:hypothetical protein
MLEIFSLAALSLPVQNEAFHTRPHEAFHSSITQSSPKSLPFYNATDSNVIRNCYKAIHCISAIRFSESDVSNSILEGLFIHRAQALANETDAVMLANPLLIFNKA